MFILIIGFLLAHASVDLSQLPETPKKVCSLDNCKGTWSNPLPRGQQWISVGKMLGGCCFLNRKECEGCVDPQGDIVQDYLRNNPQCQISGKSFSGGCTADGLWAYWQTKVITPTVLPGLKPDYTKRPCRASGIAGDEECEDRIVSYKCEPSLMDGDKPKYQVVLWPSLAEVSPTYDIANGGCRADKYLVSWYDQTEDMCQSMIASPDESWGHLPVPGWDGDKSFNCMGRCGNDCGSGWTCSNWNMACFIHDICSMYHGSTKGRTDPICGDLWVQGIIPFVDNCFTEAQCPNLRNPLDASEWSSVEISVANEKLRKVNAALQEALQMMEANE